MNAIANNNVEDIKNMVSNTNPNVGGINWEHIISQALDWLMVLLVLLIILFFNRKEIMKMWGSLSPTTTPDKEPDPIRDDIASLREKVEDVPTNKLQLDVTEKKPSHLDHER